MFSPFIFRPEESTSVGEWSFSFFMNELNIQFSGKVKNEFSVPKQSDFHKDKETPAEARLKKKLGVKYFFKTVIILTILSLGGKQRRGQLSGSGSGQLFFVPASVDWEIENNPIVRLDSGHSCPS